MLRATRTRALRASAAGNAMFKSSTLSNGLRVLTYDDHTPTASIALYGLCGSRFEDAESAGSSSFLEAMLFRGTQQMSAKEYALKSASLGAHIRVKHEREAMGWVTSCPRYDVDAGLDLLTQSALSPRLDDKEAFAETRSSVDSLIKAMERDHTQLCFDNMHRAAFGDGTALGRTMIPNDAELDRLTADKIAEFHAACMQPNRSVIVGASVGDHDAFCKKCEAVAFPKKPETYPTSGKGWPKDELYVGGECMTYSMAAPESLTKFEEHNHTHIGMALRCVPISHPDYYTYSVLQSVLGGGTSFSSGGPGKGLQSKLFREVLAREGWIHGVECVSAWYSQTGMFGLYGQAPHEHATRLANLMISQIATISARLEEIHLETARNQLVSQLVLLGEARDTRVEEAAKYCLLHNEVVAPQDIMDGARAVTMDDVKRVCEDMVGSRLTYAVHGNSKQVPEFDRAQTAVKAMYNRHCK